MTAVYRLDGQQIIAGKKSFCYPPHIEDQRRLLVLFAGMIKAQEKITLARPGNTHLTEPPPNSVLEDHVLFFSSLLDRCPDLEFLAREKTFNEYMNSLKTLNWQFKYQLACSQDQFIRGLFSGDIFNDE